MWNKQVQGLLTIQHQELAWIPTRGPAQGSVVLRVPLEHLLADPSLVQSLPPSLRGNNRTVCIAADHWFGMEVFPFQSRKPSLIEPFLARKLSALHPEHPQIREFYTYECTQGRDKSPQLISYFLNEEKAYALWAALAQVEQAPLRIISPALLWQVRLGQEDPDFSQRGTLLVHLFEGDCNLCFYSMGRYVFSRDVTLPEGSGRLDVLAYEINQSLHLYSQWTKSELGRVYLRSDGRLTPSAFSAQLGREVIAFETTETDADFLGERVMPGLKGMLRGEDLLKKQDGLGIFHRESRRTDRWAPIQWYGIGLGSILAAGLACQSFFLGSILDEERQAQQSLLRAASTEGMRLSELDAAATQVLQLRDRPTCADTLSRLFASLPRQIRIRDATLSLEGSPVLSVNAMVQASGTEQLEAVLQDFVSRVRSQAKRLGSFSLRGIDVQTDQIQAGSRYLIAFRIPLT
jgi:hypothetical protein